MTDQDKIHQLTMLADSAIFWIGQCASDDFLKKIHEELQKKLKELKNEQ